MKRITIILTVIAAILAGCNLEPDVAPMPTFIGEANTTIAELLAMHEIGSEDSYDSIPMGSNIIISGYVTTSDEWGNNYKYINIEDETGGIQIKIDNKALYHKYSVGFWATTASCRSSASGPTAPCRPSRRSRHTSTFSLTARPRAGSVPSK